MPSWRTGHSAAGYLGGTLAFITLLSEGALLMVGAQAGFVDGPRVMANMAVDSWLPRRFSALSERLTMQNGVLLMGAASLAVLFYTMAQYRPSLSCIPSTFFLPSPCLNSAWRSFFSRTGIRTRIGQGTSLFISLA